MYKGAGILFYCNNEILLGKRLRNNFWDIWGLWSIPGGKMDFEDDNDFWKTAVRETKEEFGWTDSMNRLINANDLEDANHDISVTFPFSYVGFKWITFVVKLASKPCENIFPDQTRHGFKSEFETAQWFPINKLPSGTHKLIYPVLWKL
ncbi:MAG: NUDIX hydrolase [Desulfobacterales bacterium]|nr:NUDIX hydrolase [Desulfobacterales bacterium]